MLTSPAGAGTCLGLGWILGVGPSGSDLYGIHRCDIVVFVSRLCFAFDRGRASGRPSSAPPRRTSLSSRWFQGYLRLESSAPAAGDPRSLQLESDLSSFASIPPSRRLPPPPPSQHPPCRRRVCIHPLFQTFFTHLFSVSTFAAGPRLEALGFDLPTAQCYAVETAAAQQTVMWHRIERPLGGFREPFLMTAGDKLCYGAKT